MGASEGPLRTEIIDSKQGSKCCGCCCDMRRAVICVAIIQTILSLIGGIVSLNGNVFGVDTEDNDTESLEDTVKVYGILSLVGIAFNLSAFYGAITFNKYLVYLCAVWYVALYIANIAISIEAVDKFNEDNPNDQMDRSDLTPGLVIAAIIMALFVYPSKFSEKQNFWQNNLVCIVCKFVFSSSSWKLKLCNDFSFFAVVGFANEVNEGIMTPETYAREAFCCSD